MDRGVCRTYQGLIWPNYVAHSQHSTTCNKLSQLRQLQLPSRSKNCVQSRERSNNLPSQRVEDAPLVLIQRASSPPSQRDLVENVFDLGLAGNGTSAKRGSSVVYIIKMGRTVDLCPKLFTRISQRRLLGPS